MKILFEWRRYLPIARQVNKPPGMMNIEVIFKASLAYNASYKTPLPSGRTNYFQHPWFWCPTEYIFNTVKFARVNICSQGSHALFISFFLQCSVFLAAVATIGDNFINILLLFFIHYKCNYVISL